MQRTLSTLYFYYSPFRITKEHNFNFSNLQPDYYRDAAHFRLVGEGPQYRLEIPYAKLDFTGTYSVIARNCHGEAKAVISLQIDLRER